MQRPLVHRDREDSQGEANYFDVVVDGKVNADVVCYYPDPNDAANNITGHVVFWRGEARGSGTND